MVVMNACGDGEAKTLFSESAIGDTDGDGSAEFLDGWGHPISFIRWPAGFDSDVQLSPSRLKEIHDDAEASAPGTGDKAIADALAKDPDPFDLFRRDMPNTPGPNNGVYASLRDQIPAYRLIPLIYSGGRDDAADINNDTTLNSDPNTWLNPYALAPNGVLPGTRISLDSNGQVEPPTQNISVLGVSFVVDKDSNRSAGAINNHLISTR